MRKPRKHIVRVAVVALLGVTGMVAVADAHARLNTRMTGEREVPVCSTTGEGRFHATVSDDETSVTYHLTYELEGTVTQAHIHLGKRTEAGGIMVWLCGTATNPGPAGTPVCPDSPGTISGTLDATAVVSIATQGVNAGEFAEFLRALRQGLAYANVHSSICPPGSNSRKGLKPRYDREFQSVLS